MWGGDGRNPSPPQRVPCLRGTPAVHYYAQYPAPIGGAFVEFVTGTTTRRTDRTSPARSSWTSGSLRRGRGMPKAIAELELRQPPWRQGPGGERVAERLERQALHRARPRRPSGSGRTGVCPARPRPRHRFLPDPREQPGGIRPEYPGFEDRRSGGGIRPGGRGLGLRVGCRSRHDLDQPLGEADVRDARYSSSSRRRPV